MCHFYKSRRQGSENDLIRFGITHKELHIIGNGNVNGIDVSYFNRTDEILRQAESIREKVALRFVLLEG